jgi:hypothetical protein
MRRQQTDANNVGKIVAESWIECGRILFFQILTKKLFEREKLVNKRENDSFSLFAFSVYLLPLSNAYFSFAFKSVPHLSVNLIVGWLGQSSRGEGVVTSGSSSLQSLCKSYIDNEIIFNK